MYTQQHIDALKEALAQGVSEVTYNGRTVKYRSLNGLRSVIAEMERSLNGKKDKTYYPTFDRGF